MTSFSLEIIPQDQRIIIKYVYVKEKNNYKSKLRNKTSFGFSGVFRGHHSE